MKKRRSSNILIVCFGLLTVLTMQGCKRDAKLNGFFLQRFNVVSDSLISLIHQEEDSADAWKFRLDDDINVLNLRVYNSQPEFCFSTANREGFSESYIYLYNLRIVGYIETNRRPLIILSRENDIFKFERIFYKFLIPTDEKKQFDFIYFPDNYYHADKKGYPTRALFFDPNYRCYAFKDSTFIRMHYGN